MAGDPEFITKARADIQRLRGELKEAQQQLRRAEAALAYYEQLMAGSEPVQPMRQQSNGTIAGAALAHIEARPGTAKTATAVSLMEALQGIGKLPADRKRAYRLVVATLGRDKRFRKIEPGIWGRASDGSISAPEPSGEGEPAGAT